MKVSSLCIFLLLTHFSFASKIDSLNIVMNNSKEDTNRVWLYNLLGKEHLRTNPLKAKDYFTLGLALSNHLHFLSGKIDLNKNLGTSFYYMGLFDSTAYYWEESMELVPTNQLARKADAFNNMGIISQQMGKMDTSLYYHSEALQLRLKVNDSLDVASSLANMATLYRQKGNFQKGLELYFNALTIYETYEQSKQVADVLNGIGLLYKDITEYDLSLDYLNRSLKIRQEIGDPRQISGSLNNISTINMELGNVDAAENSLKNYLDLCVLLKDYRGEAGAYSNLGALAKGKGDLDSGSYYYQKALSLFQKLGDVVNIALVSNNLGYIRLATNQPKEAIAYFEVALAYANEHQSLDYQKHVHKGLAQSYSQIKDFEAAYFHQNKLTLINDSIFHKGLETEIANFQEKYEAEKREREIAQLQTAAAEDNLKIEETKRIRNTVIIVALLLTCLFVFILFLYRLRNKIHIQQEIILSKEKEEMTQLNELKEKQIELKNRELSAFATHSVQKNELLGKLVEKLSDLKKKNKNLDVFEIELLLKKSINIDADWDTYKRHFVSVHPRFFKQLNEKHPVLSANDLRVCAYIRMNLSTKEIATLMNITPKSVRMNRYRLKKKLDLPEEQEVYLFLNSI